MSKQQDISIIVTCHAEGILLHKTLLSIMRALHFFKSSINVEIIVHLDNPTNETVNYVKRAEGHFPNIQIFTNNFGDPGKSRDFCIKHSVGKYIALIDGDDLMSQNWLNDAYQLLEGKPYGKYVAHSAMTIEFGGFNSIVQKYASIDKDTDTLLNVWSARWNSIIFAPSPLLKKLGYPNNKSGYGYEDWLISCSFIDEGIENILVPRTVMFVRRKESDSVWDAMRADSAVLPSHHILSFENIRKIALEAKFLPGQSTVNKTDKNRFSSFEGLQLTLKELVRNTRLETPARKLLALRRNQHAQKSFSNADLPKWLLSEWESIHSIERLIFPLKDSSSNISVYHSITELHYRMGGAYRTAIGYTRYNAYDYILFVPWLVSGGADSFAINYANATARYNPRKKVLVLATMQGGAESVWKEKLDKAVDFIPLNQIFSLYMLDPEHQNRILEQLVENSHATHLHILNSIAGYDFLRRHKKYLSGSDKKVIVTSFSESIDESGRTFGFSHTHVPYVYEECAYITTDNSVVQNMWVNLYGFSEEKILLHRPMIDSKKTSSQSNALKQSRPHSSKKVLWAARLAPEKLPNIIIDIANLLPHVEFDMYGTPDPNFDSSFLNRLPSNVVYRGPFNNFFSLPLESYSAYLYTSLFDGLPNALLEASVAHLPIITSMVGGIPDFISENTGMPVYKIRDPQSYAKAIATILDDPASAQQLAKRAYDQLSNGYEPESHYHAITEMLRKLNY